MAKAGRKKKVKKARGIQAGSPTKATGATYKKQLYKNKQKQMKGLDTSAWWRQVRFDQP